MSGACEETSRELEEALLKYTTALAFQNILLRTTLSNDKERASVSVGAQFKFLHTQFLLLPPRYQRKYRRLVRNQVNGQKALEKSVDQTNWPPKPTPHYLLVAPVDSGSKTSAAAIHRAYEHGVWRKVVKA